MYMNRNAVFFSSYRFKSCLDAYKNLGSFECAARTLIIIIVFILRAYAHYTDREFSFCRVARDEIYGTRVLQVVQGTITNYGKSYKNWFSIFVCLVPVKKKKILKASVYNKNRKKTTINNSKCSIAFVHLPSDVVR